MTLPPADANVFETFFQYPYPANDLDPIITVNVVSLVWLENSASSATSRSPFWGRSTLDSVNKQAKDYLARLDGFHTMLKDREFTLGETGSTKGRLLRAIAASQLLLSLPEAPVPLLPVDVTFCIFQWVALESAFEAKQLSLVSRTVQKWVDLYVFKRLILLDQTAYDTLVNLRSPRLLQAKTEYFSAVALDFQIDTHFCKEFPAVRSISFLGYPFCPPTTIPSLCRLHLDRWNATGTPLTLQIFQALTHLSIQPNVYLGVYKKWDLSALKQLSNLTHLMFHSHSDRSLYPNEQHAVGWTNFVVQKLIPYLPPTLHLLIWVAGEVLKEGSFEEYKPLWDGSLYPQLVLAFRKGDPNSDRHQTSESAGSGSSAYVYSVHPSSRSVGLDWLEWLWEDVERFATDRRSRHSSVDE